MCVKDFEKIVKGSIDKSAYGYYSAGADEEYTVKRNERAFSKILLYPRVLVDMGKFSTKTTIFGHPVDLPFGVAPVAMQKLIHPKGELLAAKEAFEQKTAYGLSMLSTTSMG